MTTIGETQQQRAVTQSLPLIVKSVDELDVTLREMGDILDRIAFALEIIAGIVPKKEEA